MVVQSISSIYRKMRDKKSASIKFMIDCHPLCHGDAQWCLCHVDTFASSGHAWPFPDYIANLNPMVTNCITPQRFIDGIHWNQIRTKEMRKLPNTGVAAHWRTQERDQGKVDSKRVALGMNWIKDLVELQDASNGGDAMGFVDSVKRISSQEHVFTPNDCCSELPRFRTYWLCYAIHTQLERRLQVPLMVVWFPWLPNLRQVKCGLEIGAIPILVLVVTKMVKTTKAKK